MIDGKLVVDRWKYPKTALLHVSRKRKQIKFEKHSCNSLQCSFKMSIMLKQA